MTHSFGNIAKPTGTPPRHSKREVGTWFRAMCQPFHSRTAGGSGGAAKRLVLMASLLFLLTACSDSKRDAIGRVEAVIETSVGDITVRLYDDTPLHRDNFIRLAKAGVYDGVLFNRIVKDMCIQAGDPSLRERNAAPMPDIDYDYTIPAEIVYPHHFHKQGALAMAHEPDSVNPEHASSSTQWYIVTGQKQTSAQLAELQALVYQGKVEARFKALQRQHADELTRLTATDHAAQQALLSALEKQAEEELAKNPPPPFTDVQKQTYASKGGAPHLDADYTVFGEVVDGMPIALRIGRTPTDGAEHPLKQVVVKRVRISRE